MGVLVAPASFFSSDFPRFISFPGFCLVEAIISEAAGGPVAVLFAIGCAVFPFFSVPAKWLVQRVKLSFGKPFLDRIRGCACACGKARHGENSSKYKAEHASHGRDSSIRPILWGVLAGPSNFRLTQRGLNLTR